MVPVETASAKVVLAWPVAPFGGGIAPAGRIAPVDERARAMEELLGRLGEGHAHDRRLGDEGSVVERRGLAAGREEGHRDEEGHAEQGGRDSVGLVAVAPPQGVTDPPIDAPQGVAAVA